MYYLPWRTKIVISDIDGTITKSDVLGHLLPAMGLDWSHPGIAQLLTNIRQNNYLVRERANPPIFYGGIRGSVRGKLLVPWIWGALLGVGAAAGAVSAVSVLP